MTTPNFPSPLVAGRPAVRNTDCLLQHGDRFAGGEDHRHRFAGGANAQNANSQLEKCSATMGTLAIVEDPRTLPGTAS